MSERPIPLEPDAIFTAQPENIEVWNFGEPQIYMDAVEAENKRLLKLAKTVYNELAEFETVMPETMDELQDVALKER